jgi:hypothetical protein
VVACWGGLAVVDLTPDGVWTVSGVAVLVVVCSIHQHPVAAVAIAVTGWLFVVGFVSNALGELAPDGRTDLVRLGVLLVAALGVARLTRRHGDR